MTLQEIKEIARQRGLQPGRRRKSELVRHLQAAEGNEPCFDTGKATTCGQQGCLWRQDCP